MINVKDDITFMGSGNALFDPLVEEAINMLDVKTDSKEIVQKLHFTLSNLYSKDQKYSSMHAPTALDELPDELSPMPNKDMLFGEKKGVYQKQYGGKFVMSRLFTQWADVATSLNGAKPDILNEVAGIRGKTDHLVEAYNIATAELVTNVLAKGFSVTAAEGPGSPTPKGQPLFSNSHTVKAGGTQSNLVVGPSYTNTATGIAQLQSAIDKLKLMVDENGKKIKTNGQYELFCSRAKEVFWRQVLNNGSQFTGTGSNSNAENQFSFDNNTVKLTVIDTLGDLDGKGNVIGNNDMWFLMNVNHINWAKAFRCYSLAQPMIKSYMNDDNLSLVTSIYGVFGADHYGAELGIVGCQS